MSITDLVSRFCDEMIRLQYSTKYIRAISAVLAQIVKMHEQNGKTQLDNDIINNYIVVTIDRFSQDKVGKYYSKLHTSTAQRLMEFSKSGNLEPFRFALPKTPLDPFFDAVIDEYVAAVAQTPQQRKSRAWAPKRFANWLISHNIRSFQDANVQDIRNFLLDDIKQLKSKTVPTLRSEMRRFCNWACEKGYSSDSYESLFEFRIAIERKIKPAPLPEEVALVLNAINRDTAEGKRSYAIVILGVVMGLRGCDVVNLKLGDIDWRYGEIRITQTKTGKALSLPLTQDVGDALSDYVLNARPKSDADNVFLRLKAPILPLASGRSPGAMYSNYRKKLGLPPNGFHSLRRALGRNLVTSGTPITTVSQILGHSDITNTKQYISLDTTHLKECALDFKGIEPEGWVL